MKGLLSKKFLAFTLAAAIAIPATPVFAVDPVTTAAIDLTVKYFKDSSDGKKVENPAKTGLHVSIQDSSGNVVDKTVSESSGKYSITGLDKKDTYSITVNENTYQYATIKVPITAFSAKAKAVALTWADSDDLSSKKIGAVGGIVTDGNGGVTANNKLLVKSSTVTYTTYSDTNGSFKAYVPAGKYDLIVTAADSNSKNVLYPLTVTAGQTAAPLDTLNSKTAKDSAFPGLTVDSTFKGDSTTITGKVNGTGTTVSVFSVTYGTYTLLGTGVSKVAKDSSTSYSIKLPSAQPAADLVIRAEDKAGNQGEISYTVAKAAVSAIKKPTTASVGGDISITYTDLAKKFHTSITKVTYGGNELAVTDYTYGQGKLTIKAGTIPAGTYDIVAQSTGYEDLIVTGLEIKASTVAAPALTAAAAAGTAVDSTKITITNTKADSSNVYQVVYGSSSTLLKKFDKIASPSIADYTSGSDIVGVNSTTSKYVQVYEVNAEGQVVKARLITLTAAAVKAPTLGVTASVYDKTLTWTASATLDTASKPAATAFKLTVTGATYTVTDVNFDGKDVKLTLSGAPSADFKITYTAPSSNGLQSASGNKIATVKDANVTVEDN